MAMSDVVLPIPHSSTGVPADVRERLCLDDAALTDEILRMTDHHTEALFELAGRMLNAATVVFPVSRLVVDPERFEDDAFEPMARVGMGVIYTKTSSGAALRNAQLTMNERMALLDRYYRPHHARLEAAVDDALKEQGHCLVIDCHSFPARSLPYELDQEPDRPDICLGTDEFHTPDSLCGLAKNAFERAGLKVSIDRPFAGAMVPMKFYRENARVSALMIEVNRRLYMDEDTGLRSANFGVIQQMLARALTRVRESHGDGEGL